ncbi:hypothetical protein SGFS_012050 [Streptomyces graminofaciens]|uniref:Secreted protein n=1 Tax=Streptomyces graminofaciens TaxID=68212 RepID=A0ABM7F2D7_9ACTN|nr:hypothetical protein SGFS_012050 [Streptomyces graminofaciens]
MESSEAVPKVPLALFGHALVVTLTVEPVVLTEIPETAAADWAAAASGSAAAATTVRPERRSGLDIRIGLPSGGTVGGTSLAPPRIGEPVLPRSEPTCPWPRAHADRPRAGDEFPRPAHRPPHPAVLTVRSTVYPPHVPSGSFARIRTRYDTPFSRPT